jgi:hypothetical protein
MFRRREESRETNDTVIATNVLHFRSRRVRCICTYVCITRVSMRPLCKANTYTFLCYYVFYASPRVVVVVVRVFFFSYSDSASPRRRRVYAPGGCLVAQIAWDVCVSVYGKILTFVPKARWYPSTCVLRVRRNVSF